MRVFSISPRRPGQKTVYLDTSDWSYLETGRHPSAGSLLRSLAESGRVRFVVTFDHIAEIAGLESGLHSRLTFMHAFPGTVMVRASGSQLLRLAACDLAIEMTGRALDAKELPCSPFADESLPELVSAAESFATVREFQGEFAAISAETNREGGQHRKSRLERDADRKLDRLARAGKDREVEEHLRATAQRAGHASSTDDRSLMEFYRRAASEGLMAPCAGADRVFDLLVTSELPTWIASNEKLMGALLKLWSDPEALDVMSPALACAKRLLNSVASSHKPQKISSTEHDKNHAVFAPMVDVFTCDSRAQPIIETALARARIRTAVLTTDSLSEVAEAVGQ
jgi:hypothetical protein